MAKIDTTGMLKKEQFLYDGFEVLPTGVWDKIGQAEVIFQDGPLWGAARWFSPSVIVPPPLRLEFSHGKDDLGDLPGVQARAGEDGARVV